jgi:transmembrane sensor
MTRPKELDATIVARYLAGESNAAESALVEAWLASDQSRRSEFEELRRVWSYAAPIERTIDVDAAWRKVSGRMGNGDARANVAHPEQGAVRGSIVTRPAHLGLERRGGGISELASFQNVLRAAAVVLFLIGTSATYQRLTAPPHADEPRRITKQFSSAAGQRAIVDLPDGTRMVLAPATHVTLTLPVDGAGLREATLDGEAMFTVTHDSARPFVVHSRYGTTVDIGTTFAVRAYANTPYRVAVREGAVAIGDGPFVSATHGSGIANGAWPMLVAGDVATRGADGQMLTKHGQGVAAMLDWTSGRLTFDHQRFADLVPDLERWYGVRIRIATPALRDRSVSGQFDTESRSEAFDALGRALGARHSISGTIVTFFTQ